MKSIFSQSFLNFFHKSTFQTIFSFHKKYGFGKSNVKRPYCSLFNFAIESLYFSLSSWTKSFSSVFGTWFFVGVRVFSFLLLIQFLILVPPQLELITPIGIFNFVWSSLAKKYAAALYFEAFLGFVFNHFCCLMLSPVRSSKTLKNRMSL